MPGGSLCGVMANVPLSNIIVSKFKLQSHYYVHLETLEKSMNIIIPLAMG